MRSSPIICQKQLPDFYFLRIKEIILSFLFAPVYKYKTGEKTE